MCPCISQFFVPQQCHILLSPVDLVQWSEAVLLHTSYLSPEHANLKLSHGPDYLHQPRTGTCWVKSSFTFKDKTINCSISLLQLLTHTDVVSPIPQHQHSDTQTLFSVATFLSATFPSLTLISALEDNERKYYPVWENG